MTTKRQAQYEIDSIVYVYKSENTKERDRNYARKLLRSWRHYPVYKGIINEMVRREELDI